MNKDEVNKLLLEEEKNYLKRKKSIFNFLKVKKVNPNDKKLRVALITDVDNWAFANIARNFKKNTQKLDIEIIAMSYIDGDLFKMWLLCNSFDVIHFFCRGLTISGTSDDLKNKIRDLGGNYGSFYKKYIKNKVLTTCVYDHLFLNDDIDFTKYLFSNAKYYYVSSQKLKDIYDKLELKYLPSRVITDGVDLSMFYPINIDRFNNINKRKIKIGWVGNSNWVNNKTDHKGINSIIKPAVLELQKEGYNVELLTSDKFDKMIPIDEMKDFYAKLDIYVCASISEGTPNPVLEAMACGVPVISTDVGIVSEVLGENAKDNILSERSVSCLKEKIVFLINNPDRFKILSNENLQRIKKWSWKYKTKDFEEFIINSYIDSKGGNK